MEKWTEEILGDLFSEKQFRAQLCYFEDIDYTEEVEFISKSVATDEIKNMLIQYGTTF